MFWRIWDFYYRKLNGFEQDCQRCRLGRHHAQDRHIRHAQACILLFLDRYLLCFFWNDMLLTAQAVSLV